MQFHSRLEQNTENIALKDSSIPRGFPFKAAVLRCSLF